MQLTIHSFFFKLLFFSKNHFVSSIFSFQNASFLVLTSTRAEHIQRDRMFWYCFNFVYFLWIYFQNQLIIQ